MSAPRSSAANAREVGNAEGHSALSVRSGYLLIVTFVLMTSVREVYFGRALQKLDPFVLALIMLSLCTVVFLPRNGSSVRSLVKKTLTHPQVIFFLNVTNLLGWLGFLFALKLLEPAVASAIYYGIGPIAVLLVCACMFDGYGVTRSDARAIVQIVVVLAALAYISVEGFSGIERSKGQMLAGVALAVVSGLGASVSDVLIRVAADRGFTTSELLATRFWLTIVGTAIAVASLYNQQMLTLLREAFPQVALITVFLTIGPIYLLQRGIAICHPLAVSVLLQSAPIATYIVQFADRRVRTSGATFLLLSILFLLIVNFMRNDFSKERS